MNSEIQSFIFYRSTSPFFTVFWNKVYGATKYMSNLSFRPLNVRLLLKISETSLSWIDSLIHN